MLVDSGGTRLLVDAGISTRRITASLASLGLTPAELDGVLLTHEHSDHTAGLMTLTKRYRLPLYATGGTAAAVQARMPVTGPVLRVIPRQGTFSVRDTLVTTFPTSHDAVESVDFRFDHGGAAAAVLTDTGCISRDMEETLTGVSLLVLESNHDVEWLRSGPYPEYLKQRILGPRGHLSNEAAAALARYLAERGTRQFVLAHLSRENNTPARALQVTERALGELGASVTVAPRDVLSGPYRAEVCVCSV